MNRSWIFSAVLLLGLSAISACNGRTEAASSTGAVKVKAIHVDTIVVANEEMPSTLLVAGSLKANQESELAANASGRVTRTMVERGSYVARGAPLAQLDMRMATLSAGEASANLDTARTQKQLADDECKRYEGLLAKGALSQQEYDRQSASCKTASSSASAALSRADAAAQTLSDATVRAPFSGLVAERYVSVGEYVRPDSKVVHLVDIDPLRLEMTIPEQSLSAVKQGQSVDFVVGAFPNQTFHGVVHYIGPSVRAQTRDLVFEAVVPNKDRLLRPGLFATARLDAGTQTLAVVPKSALRIDGETTRLYAVVDKHIEERVVQTGAQRGDRVAYLERRQSGRGGRRPPCRGHHRRPGSRVAHAVAGQFRCVRRPVFAAVLMLVIFVVGTAGYFKLGLDLFPARSTSRSSRSLLLWLDGAAPEEVESEISQKIEEAVNTINGIDELRSVSVEGVSQVLVTFSIDKDINVAAQDVRDHVNLAMPNLPKGVDPPVIGKFDPDAVPILYIAVHSNRSVRETTEVADKRIRRLIESIPGVGQVSLIGGRKRQINVWLDPVQLRSTGLTPQDVQRSIGAQNLTTPGGTVDTGPTELTLRVQGRVTSPQALAAIVVKESNGHPIRLSDVARVEDGEEQQDSIAYQDGKPVVMLTLRKQSGENTVAVVDAVRDRLGDIQKTLGTVYTLEVVRDNSGQVRTSVAAVKEHLVVGALLA